MLRIIARWGWRWARRRGTGRARQVGTIAVVLGLVRRVVSGRPETVFSGSLEPGTGIQIRVLEPGER